MKKRISGFLAVLLLAAMLSTGPVIAGIDIDFGAAVRAGDDADLYFSISSRYFDRDRAVIERVAVHYGDPDDLAVSLFIANRSGRSPDRIYAMRQRGLSWWDISVRLGIPADIWFVKVNRDPGPPYGKAYGYWKKHKHDRNHVVVLTDVDVRNLVAVRMIHEYYGVSVEAAMDWRSSGRDLRHILSGEYHKRHGKTAHHKASKGGGKSTPPGHNKGHGRGKKK